ncbi:MAG: DNA methylase [Lachnospiraceae bacterium]|nr:DNA methylase [Lachnospiraceae bacterium]
MPTRISARRVTPSITKCGKRSNQVAERFYIAIDLKSFYASVECVERGLDPLKARLVVADKSRTEKTICLAVSPALKELGIPGRPRLFEVVQRAKELGGIDYEVAKPRMALYMDYSTRIYKIYLRFVAPEDIFAYSVDEVFIDATSYLNIYKMTPHELALKMIRTVQDETGITATAGIGTNLYLAKIAMDIEAKHMPADKDGVRIAELDEMSYRRQLWEHTPVSDFWRVGRGYRRKLEANGLYTMGDVAKCSVGKPGDYYNEELLYKLFGINAELLIDHAWGWEPCTLVDVKAYKPENNSISQGQVLQEPYDHEKGRIIVREMAEMLSYDLVVKHLVTDQIVLTVGYDVESLTNPEIKKKYKGEVTTDHYGRQVPKHAHGTCNLDGMTSSTEAVIDGALAVYDREVNKNLLIRRIYVVANHAIDEGKAAASADTEEYEQLDLFTDYEAKEEEELEKAAFREKEKRLQDAMIDIKLKFGKNAIVRGTSMQEGATGLERNRQIGGHKA